VECGGSTPPLTARLDAPPESAAFCTFLRLQLCLICFIPDFLSSLFHSEVLVRIPEKRRRFAD
jgi:hypothetical protein